MKAFFEEYGLAIVIIIIIAALIGLSVYTANNGKKDMTQTYTNFTDKANQTIDTYMNIDGTGVGGEVTPPSGEGE